MNSTKNSIPMVYEIMVAENSRATESLGGRAVVSKWGDVSAKWVEQL